MRTLFAILFVSRRDLAPCVERVLTRAHLQTLFAQSCGGAFFPRAILLARLVE
jgi:hypothetical protein